VPLFEHTEYKNGQTDVQASLHVWKQNRSGPKNKNILNSLASVSHKNKLNAANSSENVEHPCSNQLFLILTHASFSTRKSFFSWTIRLAATELEI